jgi:putative sigma-54 modulation protein
MNIHFTARREHLTPQAKALCEERLEDIARWLGPSADADVILSRERNREKAEVHIRAKGAGFVVAEESADILVSLGLAFDALERKVRKEREKLREKKRRVGREAREEGEPSEPASPGPKIVRFDYFASKPMSIGEALIQLDAKKKEVFVFRPGDGDRWAVLFRRKNGTFGLVQPE